MKASLVTFIAAIGLIPTTTFAQQKFQVAEVDQMIANPDQYRGKIVALHGFIDQVDLEQKSFSLVDSKSASSARGTNMRSLVATMQVGSHVPIPESGQEVVVIGQIGEKDGLAHFTASQMFTNRDKVQQILTQGSVVREPGKRPGDNLGHDAQPPRNISQ